MAGSLENRGKLRELIDKFKFVNLPFERGENLFSKGFFDFTDIRKLQDKAKTSYTLSTRRLRFGYEQQFSRSTPRAYYGMVGEEFTAYA